MTTANAMEMVKALLEMIDDMPADVTYDGELLVDARDMIDEFYGEDA